MIERKPVEAMDGMEQLLRAFGLGSRIDEIKAIVGGLIDSGTVPKLIGIAGEVEGIRASLKRIEKRLGIETSAVIEGEAGGQARLSGPGGRGAEPDPGGTHRDAA